MSFQRVPGAQQSNPVNYLEIPQVNSLSRVLSRAFHDEPHIAYLIPDKEMRHTVSPWFFQAVIRAGQLYGEIYTTDSADGAALWMRPEHDWTLRQVLRAGMIGVPFYLKWGVSRRSLKLSASLAAARKRLAPAAHWYLMALAVGRSEHEEAVARALIQPVLSRADATDTSCYLETFSEKKLGFYKRHGFRIAGAGRIPGGGPAFWAMVRPA
jgi:hypothetical protein